MIQSALLRDDTGAIRHGFFTRQGGVSEGLYASLNCGLGSADDAGNVRENRSRVASRLGGDPAWLITAHQVHSPRAVIAEAPWPGSPPQADAIVTRTPGLIVGVLSADCAPILLADAEAKVIAAVHAGWRGALGGVIEAAVEAMERLGAARERIAAEVGPAISSAAYEIGDAFETAFMQSDSANARFFSQAPATERRHFDLPGYCMHALMKAGIGSHGSLGRCTYADESLFFSYRRVLHRGEADYGRQISAILIE